ncbi:Outer arm dynein light chain 1 protein [Zea mays]|uniref:Outer arm dynein light chain 1 protein n=1 Tax=Zea mays TaxID=4577 RepID=A0A1D6HR34_MAIZE|nr:Outer arm dynein light chain 1 protein [Zea mays]
MVRFFCFSSSTAHHRSKEVFSPADETMHAASKKDYQLESMTGSVRSNQMTEENNRSAVSGHCGSSPSSHQECCRSEDLNRYVCSDEGKEVGHLKKSQSLVNMLQKDHGRNSSEGSEVDVTNHEHKYDPSNLKRSEVVGESSKLYRLKNEDDFDASSDLISHDFCEPLGDHTVDSDSHHDMPYSQSNLPRSQSAIFQNDCTSDPEGSVDSEILGCRSVDGLCSLTDEKFDYLRGGEMYHCKSNLDVYCAPSPNMHRASNIDDHGSVGCSDVAAEGQRSTGSTEEFFVRDGILVGHEYWDGKYICGDHSLGPVALFCADYYHSGNDVDLSEATGQERELSNRDSTLHQSLVVEVPESVSISDTNDISGEPEHSRTDIDEDPSELTPRTYNKQPIRATGSKDVSDRHTRKISSSHHSDRGGRPDRRSSRLVGAPSAHKPQSSRHGRSGYVSSSALKYTRARNTHKTSLGSRPLEHASAIDLAKQTQTEGRTQ